MGIVDRDVVLERTDLRELATEICGLPQRLGPSAKWRCPNPNHPDEHPSMGIYRNRRGQQRWKCHACGEGGTAVDLLMISGGLDAGRALRELAERAGVRPTGDDRFDRRTATRPSRPGPPAPRNEPSPEIEAFVARTTELLWTSTGAGARRHLESRGFDAAVLRANRVGFDPGPAVIPRSDGLPKRGPGIVYPVLDDATGQAVTFQTRYLSPRVANQRKYDQPTSDLAPNPRFGVLRLAVSGQPGMVVLCEGFPDALSAAHAGLPAVAILGVGQAGAQTVDDLARRITVRFPGAAFAVCFDADAPAVQPAHRLADRLTRTGVAVARLTPPEGCKDLNDWWTTQPGDLTAHLKSTRSMLTPPDPSPIPSI